jgi:hypothetical protein
VSVRTRVGSFARSPYAVSAAALLTLLLAIAGYNANVVRHDVGYDFREHYAYAQQLIYNHSIPSRGDGRSEYYTPPLFYLVFGAALRFATHFGATFPDKVARAMNVPLLVGSAVLVFILGRLLWPTRRRLHLAALAFFVFLPVTLKLASMFHPETMSLFLSTLSLVVAARMLVRRDFRARTAVALGVALGLAQLVRAFTLWTFAAVLLTLLLAALVRAAPRRTILTATMITVAATVVVTAPWYIRQTVKYGNAVFAQSAPDQPIYDRRPASFYTALGLPDVFNNPTRPHYTNDFLPTVYTEIWGDYFGSWSWICPDPPTPKVARQLTDQNEIGLLPTFLAIGGCFTLLLLCARPSKLRAHPERLLVPLLSLGGLVGLLYFAMSYPTSDGDTIKASYMLTTAPGWALSFGLAFDWLASRAKFVLWSLMLLLAACAITDLGFLIYANPLMGG